MCDCVFNTQPHTQPLLLLSVTQGFVLHAQLPYVLMPLDRALTPHPPSGRGAHTLTAYSSRRTDRLVSAIHMTITCVYCHSTSSPRSDPTTVSRCDGSPLTHFVRTRVVACHGHTLTPHHASGQGACAKRCLSHRHFWSATVCQVTSPSSSLSARPANSVCQFDL